MKKVLQSLASGEISVEDVPAPRVGAQEVAVATRCSLISPGTERMLLEFGRSGWLQKARSQPDKVRMVLEKVKTDGVAAAVEAVRSKLDQPLEPGYCNVGVVIAVGSGVTEFAVGDRVVSNAPHAEIATVGKNLCARVPDSVPDEHAAITVLAAIGLQGVRLVQPTLGESVVVIGLGPIGLLTVQLLRANGCRVLGVDFSEDRLALARSFGADTVAAEREDVLDAAARFSSGRGADAVIITAATKSNEPVMQAAQMCRKRGRIVLVGVAGLELSRVAFYEKELSFQVSCSYGPGRYDPSYEEAGNDYPLGFVRWTEQRNFEAVLDLMASGRLDPSPLITHRFAFEDAPKAYDLLTSGEPSLGILLEYGSGGDVAVADRTVSLPDAPVSPSSGGVAFLGAGNYAGRVLMPAFKAAGASLHTVVSGGGVSAVHHGKKHGFALASTDGASVLSDPSVGVVVVATRHNAHAAQVLGGLRSGKHVFCEKPLCLTPEELAEIEAEAAGRPGQLLMVGFNRRFAPHVVKVKSLLASVASPKRFVMTVNAGELPADHWTVDPVVGGGRIVGEGCHFIDLLRHLAGVPVSAWSASGGAITMSFADGSVGTVHYLESGHRGFPKERLEVFCGGRVLQLDNFRKLRGWGWSGFRSMNLWRQDKGQRACVAAFMDAVRNGGAAPIPLSEILEVSRLSIEMQKELRV